MFRAIYQFGRVTAVSLFACAIVFAQGRVFTASLQYSFPKETGEHQSGSPAGVTSAATESGELPNGDLPSDNLPSDGEEPKNSSSPQLVFLCDRVAKPSDGPSSIRINKQVPHTIIHLATHLAKLRKAEPFLRFHLDLEPAHLCVEEGFFPLPHGPPLFV